MSKSKTLLAAMAALAVAFPASAQIGVSAGGGADERSDSGTGARIESKSDIELGMKASSSLRIKSGATGTINLRVKERGSEDESATGTKKEGEGDEHQSERARERSVSGKEFFKGEGFGGIVITPRAFHVDGNMVRIWTKDDEMKIKEHGASDDDMAVVKEAKDDENITDIDIENDDKTGHGTVVVKYEAKVKILGFISVVAPVIATSSDSGVVVEVVAPWYIRWFAPTGTDEQIALSLASKIKARHDASISAGVNVK